MTENSLKGMTVDQLVARFVELALGQNDADLDGDIARYNRLYKQLEEVENQLRARAGDQRRALLPLCGHPNAQVRLTAAIAILVLDPRTARQTLQTISDRNEYPQAANARGMMRALDEGRFVPS